MKNAALFGAAAILLATSLPVAAQNLKPGLWEIHNKMSGNAELDQAMAEMQKELAAMPPEQRKQMEAMMAQRGMQMPRAGAGGAMAMRVCMSREMVARDDVPMQEGCRITSRSRSGNTLKMAFSCSNPPSSGEGQFTYLSSEAYRSRMTMKTGSDGKSETMTTDATGKWLGADCGNIKPMVAPKK